MFFACVGTLKSFIVFRQMIQSGKIVSASRLPETRKMRKTWDVIARTSILLRSGERNKMPKRIPICAAKKFVKEQDLRHVIICAWDGKLSHVVTYGRTVEDCVQAAEGGNRIKRLLGWPESLQAEPARIATQVEKWISEAQARGLLDWEKLRACTMEHAYPVDNHH